MRRLLLACLVVAVAASACAVPFVTKTDGGGILVVALDSPVLTLDPANATDLSSARATTQVYETLVELNPETGAFDPLLAQSWAVTGDGRIWTFTLRSGVFFHDGTPFTSDAVVENFNRWMDPAHPAHRGDFDYWQILFGGFKGSGSLVRMVERVDDLRLRIILERPHSPLLAALTMHPFAIVSPAAMRKDVDALHGRPVGTGPFQFVSQAGGQVVLQANRRYWGGQPKLAAVHFTVIADGQARLNALREGRVHVMEGGSRATVEAARRVTTVKALLRPSMSVVFLSFNQKAEPFGDAVVRQAAAQAIDRQAVLQKAFGGLGQVAGQFVPPGVAGADLSLADIRYSPAAARQALGDAGYGGGFLTQIWYPSRPRPLLPDPRAAAEAIAADLRAVGIIADLRTTDWPTYQRRALEGGFPLYLQSWTGDSPDADSFLSGLFAGDATARSIGYDSPELRTTLSSARAEGDRAARSALYAQAAATIRSDMPRLPLVHPQSVVVIGSTVKGFVPSRLGTESYRKVSL